VDLADFDYDLPPAAIAQEPLPRREASRLLVIDRRRGTLRDQAFADLPELLRPDDVLVVNDSRVVPARVMTVHARSGRPVELLFVEPLGVHRWRALARPGRHARPGSELIAGGETAARLTVLAVEGDGARVVESHDTPVVELLETHGLTPLPPYIGRHAKPDAEDRERYQTVYARTPGSVAAPTAGLHFSTSLLDRLRARGIDVLPLTLHVGPATFQPIRASRIEDHVLRAERAVITADVADAVNVARDAGRRIVAVGTTSTRALEGAVGGDGRVRGFDGPVDLYVRPGHRFRVIDALVTNFHLPRSSLLVLVSALGGHELILRAYRHAVDAGYRFYSYGDATLIE
jgi:S-adenosylmethionine:tRNA ribosyltransferase-isomerase